MIQVIWRERFSFHMRMLAAVVLCSFTMTTIIPAPAFAQMMRHTPSTSVILQPTSSYSPMVIKGIQLVPENPLRFDFIVDKGASGLNGQELKEESTQLVKYFLTALTIPEKDMWVNLSPFEKDAIIAESFAQTQVGKILLEQDYILKQLTASLTYPETTLGKQFWARVYQKAYEKFGTTDIPIDTFNKVWIVPKTADVVNYKQGAVIISSELDVMVESDYLAIQKTQKQLAGREDANPVEQNQVYSNIIREIIIPELRREVNEGEYFAPLRQVYSAMILAAWFKRNLRTGILSKIYIRQSKVDGVNSDDPRAKEKVYEQYVETFRKGIYNYIREDFDEATKQLIPRKYISGGMGFVDLGLGTPPDKYRELASPAINSFKPLAVPVIVSTDLTLLTSQGGSAGLPNSSNGLTSDNSDGRIGSANLPGTISTPSVQGVKGWFRKIIASSVFVAVLGLGAVFPMQAFGAGYSLDNQGNLVVKVEQGDTYGHIIEQMRVAYRETDPVGYEKSGLSGNLWGPQGVVERMSSGKNVQSILPESQFKFEKGLLSERAVAKLVPQKGLANVVERFEDRLVIPSIPPLPSAPQLQNNLDAPPVQTAYVNTEPGLRQFPLELILGLGGFTLWLGSRKALLSLKRKKQDSPKKMSFQKVQDEESDFRAVSKGGIKFVTAAEELPRLDDVVKVDPEVTEHWKPGIFVETDKVEASAEEDELYQLEQEPEPERAFVKTSRFIWPMDLLGAGAGVLLTGLSTDWNPHAMGIAALVMPFLTRLSYGLQIFIHEILGHFVPALVLSPERGKVLSLNNFFANFGWNQWTRLLVAGFKAPSGDQNPSVYTWASGWRHKIIKVSGFVVTFFVGVMAGIESMNIWLPLLGPVGISSLSVLAGSYATDIKSRDMAEGAVDDQCGRSECGIFGALWSDKSNEMYPQWIRDGFGKLINALIIRGGQSAGEFTIGLKSSGQNSEEGSNLQMVPVLSKVLKYKRGQGLSEALDQEFLRMVNRFEKKKVQAVAGVKGILGHVRFATGGKVTREASHPHMGVQEEHDVWTLNNGSWVRKMTNIFVAIGHNGDNDAWSIWGRQYDTGQIRELFSAIFSMPKNYKVVTNKKDPKTGKEVKEVKYEALPPGDSPPLALQIHYLLTQGDWLSSARFAYVDRLINHDLEAASGLTDKEMELLTRKRLEHALSVMLSADEERKLGEAFQSVFARHAKRLLRPRLNKPDKSFTDLWVTQDIINAYPSLQYQLNALEAFKEDLKEAFGQHLRINSEVGKILLKVGNVNEENIVEFVDEAVKMFFTGSRAAAVEQFARRSQGSFGLAVRTSKELNGVSLYSSDQGLTIGYNQKSRLVTFSSEHSTLQYAFGSKGKMDDLVFINPEQPGQMADVNLNPDPNSANPITMKVYSFALNRTMTPKEISEQQFPQDASNPYWSPQISYKDPDNIVMTDIQSIPKEVRSARQSWSDPNSFNRQSAESLLEKIVSRHLERFIKENSEFYGAAQGSLISRIFEKSTECLGQGGCDAREANRRSAQLSNRLQADGRVVDYLKSRLDAVVSKLAGNMAQEITSGKLDETEMVLLLRKKIDAQLKILMDAEIIAIVDAVINGNITQLQSWSEWEEFERENAAISSDDGQAEQGQRAAEGLSIRGLGFLKNIAGKLMSSKKNGSQSELEKQGRSLDAGETDMFIAGYEDSLWFGENFVELMKVVFPKMKIWATSANKAFDLSGEHRVGRSTIGMIISKSGTTYPSSGIVRRLKQLMPGNIYAMTSRVDNLIAMSLGQKFQPNSPFTKHIFVTGNYYPAEANSVGEVMLFAHQIELALYLAEGMEKLFPEQSPWGMKVNSEDIKRLKELRDKMYDDARRLTGFDDKGRQIDGVTIRRNLMERINDGYLQSAIQRIIKENQSAMQRKTMADVKSDIKSIVNQAVRYNGPDADPVAQLMLLNLWKDLEKNSAWEALISQMLGGVSIQNMQRINERVIAQVLLAVLRTSDQKNLKMMEDVYLGVSQDIVGNGHALGKTMAETGIVNNIIFRLFVMSIFWFAAPIENMLTMSGMQFGPTLQDFGSFLVRTIDGVLTLFAPWLMTTVFYRLWSGRPHWARLGPPTVVLGDPNAALHQTGEGYWSKLGAVALGSMTMNIHGANPDDDFVARLAHRVFRGTIAIFGVPADSTSKNDVIDTMKKTKAIINGMFLNFFKGGAEVFSIGRGELNNPDVTDHHMNIGEQNLQGASETVRKFNNLAFDAFGRHIAYKMLFAHAYRWATHWEPRITLFGRTISFAKFSLWNPAWTYSRTGVHTTRTPKGGPTQELPEYLDPSEGIKPEAFDEAATPDEQYAGVPTPDEILNKEGRLADAASNDPAVLTNGEEHPILPTNGPAASSGLAPTVVVEGIGTGDEELAGPPEARKGGIDLRTKWLDLRVTGDGEMNLFLDGENIEMVPIRGIVPRILDIRSVTMNNIYLIIGSAQAVNPAEFLSRRSVPNVSSLVFRGDEVDVFDNRKLMSRAG